MPRPAAGPLPVERFFQFALLGLVASGYLAVAGSAYLDPATIVLTGAGIVLRGLMLAGVVRFHPGARAATIAAAAYILFFPVDYFFLSRDLLGSAVHLVFFLAVVKILTAQSHRDSLLIAAIAFLELLAAAILSITFTFFLCLALFLLFGIAALTSAEIRRSMRRAPATARAGLRRFHARLALLAMWIAMGILALTAGMFFLLPRTADAALSTLLSHRIRVPGYSDRVALGDYGEFQSSSRAVMHVAILRNLPMGSAKWRGDVLDAFDGRVWSRSYALREPGFKINGGHVSLGARPGTQRSYWVQFTDLESRTLFFAGTPELVEEVPDGTFVETETGCFRLPHAPPSGFRYDVAAVLEDAPESVPPRNPPPVLAAERRMLDTALPDSLDARIPALARALTEGVSGDLGRARSLENHLRHDYAYTLALPRREMRDPLADFLFQRRQGNCEYFASAMAVMLRSLGIPARLATGFQTGIYNPISDLWLVRASDAHSWVEGWIPGYGWVTFDPTPPDFSSHPLTLMSKAGLYLDAAETFWQQWVVGYDPNHQGTLADRIEQTARRLGLGWVDSFSAAGARWSERGKDALRRFGVPALVLLLAAYAAWRRGPALVRALRIRRRVDRVRRGEASVADATLLYERMLQVLHRQGYQKPPWYTPVEFARSLAAAPLGRAVEEFTLTYNELRFGGRTAEASRLSLLLDELERSARKR